MGTSSECATAGQYPSWFSGQLGTEIMKQPPIPDYSGIFVVVALKLWDWSMEVDSVVVSLPVTSERQWSLKGQKLTYFRESEEASAVFLLRRESP